MSEQKTVIPGTDESEILEKLATAKAEGVDLALLERGVWRAQEDVAMQAAIQLSQGLYPENFFRLLAPLAHLSGVMAQLRVEPERKAFFEAIERLGSDSKVAILPLPASGDSSAT